MYIPVIVYSSITFHIIAKHVDIYIVVGDTKCTISIIVIKLDKLSCSTFEYKKNTTILELWYKSANYGLYWLFRCHFAIAITSYGLDISIKPVCTLCYEYTELEFVVPLILLLKSDGRFMKLP